MKTKCFLVLIALIIFALNLTWAQDGNNLGFQLIYNDPLNSNLGGIDGAQRVEYMTVIPDSDGDGAQEIVFCPRLGGTAPQGAALEVYEATGDDTYARSWSWQGVSSVFYRSDVAASADLDGNGTREILMGVNSNVTDFLAVFENVGSNDWGTSPRLYTYQNMTGSVPAADVDFASLIAAGDFDGDGKDEVLLCNTNVQDLMIICSVASGTFAAGDVVWSLEFERNWEATDKGSPYAIAVGHIDTDNYTDIAVICWDLLRVDIYECTGANTYVLRSSNNLTATDDYSWYACEITDLDNDGNGELWLFNIQNGGLYAAEISDVATVTAVDFKLVFDLTYFGGAGNGQINMDFGDQDHGPGSDGPDLYLVGEADNKIIDLEYNGGDPLSSASWTKYDIPALTSSTDTLWMVEAPETDLDGDNLKEIVYTRQDANGTRPGGLGTDKAAPSLFVQEFTIPTSSYTWNIY